MKIGVFYVVSGTASGEIANAENMPWLKTLEEKTGHTFELAKAEELSSYDLAFSFIGGGGTEGLFLEELDSIPKPCFLLTTGANNSLAASMEILSYLRQHDIPGEIIHGSDEYVARRIQEVAAVSRVKSRMQNFRFARVGKPSDWLIASEVDASELKNRTGIDLIDIPMEEFLEEIAKEEFLDNEYTELIRKKGYDEKELKKAFEIYGALRRLVDKYSLDGVTVRCFDLLGLVHSTGCAALSILNAEGIYAACEGDVPALLSMALMGELTGEPVFMANPSRIDTEQNELVFAHCTLPINMPDDFTIMTHFESQIGVAFRGKIKEGPITLFKCDGLMEEYFVSDAELIANLSEMNLCRTQIRVKPEESVKYFLTDSIGNHHLICKGHHAELIREFFRWK